MTVRLTGWTSFASAVRGEVRHQSPDHIARLGWDGAQIEAAQRAGLSSLLAHAVKHSPFHRERLAGVDVDRVDPRDLSALPVMTKHDMMSAFDDVVTNRSLSLELIEEALAAAGEVPAAIDGQYVAMASGGSSGQRGVFVFDRAALVGFILSLSRGLLRPTPTASPPGARPAGPCRSGPAPARPLWRPSAARATTTEACLPQLVALLQLSMYDCPTLPTLIAGPVFGPRPKAPGRGHVVTSRRALAGKRDGLGDGVAPGARPGLARVRGPASTR